MTKIFKANYFPCVHFAVRKFHDLNNYDVLLHYETLSKIGRAHV